ncbi:MAG: hypothetical protein ACRD96_01510, partial [Bryobacteraceae bacterium]
NATRRHMGLASIDIVLALVAFGPGHKDGEPPRDVVESRFAPYLLDAAHVLVAIAPRELKDGFAQRYQRVKTIWKDALERRASKT